MKVTYDAINDEQVLYALFVMCYDNVITYLLRCIKEVLLTAE